MHTIHSLEGLREGAHVQGHEAVLGDSVGVGTVAQQQLGTLGLAAPAGLVQGRGTAGRQVHVGPALQQQTQAVGVAPPCRDVQGRGQLLLVGQRPQPWMERREERMKEEIKRWRESKKVRGLDDLNRFRGIQVRHST